MFTDAYDVLLLEDSPTVLGKFKTHFPDARVVFSAEPFCWPDVTLAEIYPEVRVLTTFHYKCQQNLKFKRLSACVLTSL